MTRRTAASEPVDPSVPTTIAFMGREPTLAPDSWPASRSPGHAPRVVPHHHVVEAAEALDGVHVAGRGDRRDDGEHPPPRLDAEQHTLAASAFGEVAHDRLEHEPAD